MIRRFFFCQTIMKHAIKQLFSEMKSTTQKNGFEERKIVKADNLIEEERFADDFIESAEERKVEDYYNEL